MRVRASVGRDFDADKRNRSRCDMQRMTVDAGLWAIKGMSERRDGGKKRDD